MRPGPVRSKTAELGPVQVLKRRAEQRAKIVDGDRLAISPRCGLAGSPGVNPVAEADERAKLRRCVEAARSIWG